MSARCSRIAECMDQLRIMPRFLVLAGYIFFGWLTLDCWEWFREFDWGSIENEAVSLAIVAFPTGFLSAFAAVLGSLTKAYFLKPAHSGLDDQE